MLSIVLHEDTADVARPPLFEDLDEERPELLRQYRSWGNLAASGRLDDGDELQDMRAKRFQALVDLQMLLLFDEAATSKAESSVAAGEPLPCLAATAPRNS